MYKGKRTPAGDALTGLILDLFRLNGLLLTAGDRLVAPLGLTSARWEILGAVVAAQRPQPVAWLARDLGANRQNVQRIINDLHKEGFVAFEPNPHHRRAQLIVLSDKGKETFDATMRLQAPWINSLSEGLLVKDIHTMHRVIIAVRQKLEGNELNEQGRPVWRDSQVRGRGSPSYVAGVQARQQDGQRRRRPDAD
jgi:DNA-binding MarR family transcriptional regulator